MTMCCTPHTKALHTLLLVVGMPYAVHAQLLTATNVPITITTGTTVTVEGGTLLNAASTITNQGTLRVRGDWTNNSGSTAIIAASSGTVELYGSTVQNILGSEVTDFRNLELTGGPKALQQDVVVGLPSQADGTLDLGSGSRLLLEGHTFTVFNPAGTAVIDNGGWVTSESLASRFQWALGADISEHRVPFGPPAGPAFPFAYTPAAAMAANTILSVATYQSAPDNTAYPITAVQEVTHVRDVAGNDNSDNTVDRFWLVDLPTGAFTGNLLLGYAPAEDPLAGPGPIRAQRWSESMVAWEAPQPGQSNPALREVLVPAVFFSDGVFPDNEHIWALSYENTPLPISLLHFDAVAKDNSFVHCTWTTASEQDNDHFTVERSRDGNTFEAIGDVPGAGTSYTALDYAFDDLRPYTGVSYYRLRQTDFDGTETWSQAVPVLITKGVAVSVFPNPNDGRFTILRDDAASELQLQLLDASGRVVRQWVMPTGVDRQAVDLGTASGLYTLRWNGGQAKVSVGR
jgi:hypothetical protein